MLKIYHQQTNTEKQFSFQLTLESLLQYEIKYNAE